jgi:hypothetical protein
VPSSVRISDAASSLSAFVAIASGVVPNLRRAAGGFAPKGWCTGATGAASILAERRLSRGAVGELRELTPTEGGGGRPPDAPEGHGVSD